MCRPVGMNISMPEQFVSHLLNSCAAGVFEIPCENETFNLYVSSLDLLAYRPNRSYSRIKTFAQDTEATDFADMEFCFEAHSRTSPLYHTGFLPEARVRIMRFSTVPAFWSS